MSAPRSAPAVSPAEAATAYRSRMLGASFGYVGAVLGASLWLSHGDPATPLTLLIAAVPGVFILLMLRAFRLLLRDVDEVARHDMVSAMVVSLFVILAVSGSWGLIELFNRSLPRLPVFLVFPGFFLVYGAVSAWQSRARG